MPTVVDRKMRGHRVSSAASRQIQEAQVPQENHREQESKRSPSSGERSLREREGVSQQAGGSPSGGVCTCE